MRLLSWEKHEQMCQLRFNPDLEKEGEIPNKPTCGQRNKDLRS